MFPYTPPSCVKNATAMGTARVLEGAYNAGDRSQLQNEGCLCLPVLSASVPNSLRVV